MKICWPIGAIALLTFAPLAVHANPDKLSECQIFAKTLQGAAGNLKPTGDLNTALAATGRLQQNLQGLQLRDRQLQSFQQRYLAFFATAEILLNQGHTAGDEDTLRTLIGTAQQHNLTGSALAQEMAEYCLKP
ncbi:MAG: hypothetical protein ACUVSQ_10105 [Pseudanabaenaceae cyanobacterium]